MALKDYYKILGVSPAASAEELKKAYRRLALRYHPDQNNDNRLAELQFREIKEAYETLVNPQRREAYNYERFYQYTYLRKNPAASHQQVTPEWVVQQCRQFSEYISRNDPFRLDRDAVLYHLQQLLSGYNLAVLQHAASDNVNSQVIGYCLLCTQPLNLDYTRQLCSLLQPLAHTAALQHRLQACIREKQVQQWINRYKLPAVILLALLLCLAIVFFTRSAQ